VNLTLTLYLATLLLLAVHGLSKCKTIESPFDTKIIATQVK
jgi:hypothetical protein